jgi:parallel beta-helix repeat protein
MFGQHHGIKRVLATLSSLLLGLGPAAALADTIYVCWDGSGDYLTIQAGINAASDGDEVVVCNGTYTGSGNRELILGGKAIMVRSENGPENCIIDCGGSGTGFWFENDETLASVVDGFTITNGDSGDGGGAIQCWCSSPTITNCVITGNTAWHACGGGIFCFQSSPTISNCAITGNTADADGGGIYCGYQSNPTITNCTITGNTANEGGGIYCERSSPTITDCTIAGNTSAGVCCLDESNPTITNCAISENMGRDGGGVQSYGSSPVFTNCTITANTAYRNAGIYCEGGSPTIANSTISGNTAESSAGGVYCRESNLTITNCTIAENVGYAVGGLACDRSDDLIITNCRIAANTPGGIACFSSNPTIANCAITENLWGGVQCGSASPNIVGCTIAGSTGDEHASGVYCLWGSSPTISNCILWNDTPQEIYIYSDNWQPVVRYSDIRGGWPGWGNIDADPVFVDPHNHDFHLAGGSPCIDAGCNWAVPADFADLDDDGDTAEITPLDLDGEGRFFDDPDTNDTGCRCPPIVDMGAYEFGDTGPQPCPGDLDCDRQVGPSDLGILLSCWGCDCGDLDCSGHTDQADLGILLAHWGDVCP